MERYYTSPINSLTASDFSPLLNMALEEDCPDHDITSESIFSESQKGDAFLVTREEGVFCGGELFFAIKTLFPNSFEYELYKKDGERIHKNDRIAKISGNLRDILRIERVLLNFLQYLSGISSVVYSLSKQYPNLLILDTRKTLPGYRKLVKYAVYIGGGANHRINLSDMALIKDNHIALSGTIVEAVKKVRTNFPDRKVELEIDGLFQLEEAIESKPDILLLDNFSVEDTITAIEKIKSSGIPIRIECSGGITPEKLGELSKLGNIGVSMGYITHTTRFMDLSLEIISK